MTAQKGDKIVYKGILLPIGSEPLNQYLKTKDDIKFTAPSTACWRGYYGKWEISEKKLYLIELKGYIENLKEVDLSYLFPKQEKVFANWFSGEIKVLEGDIIKYKHRGYESIYQKEITLTIDNGVLIDEKIVDNSENFKNSEKKGLIKKILNNLIG